MPGKGAARHGDTTLNCADPVDTPTGKVMVKPPCTVKINKLPAAKQGDDVMGVDIHIVMIPAAPAPPIPTPIPHQFKGMIDSETVSSVKIMGMPAAVVGSKASAVPPHIPQGGPFQKPPANKATILMGSTNVFIGQKSGSGGGSGSASGISDGIFPLSLATEVLKTAQSDTGHYFDVAFYDKSGKQIRDCKYSLKDTANEESFGHVSGHITRYGIDAGTCSVELHAIISVKWSAKELTLGSKIKIDVETIGIEDGQEAVFKIYQRDSERTDPLVGTILGNLVKDNTVSATWLYPVENDELEGVMRDSYSVPDYYCVVTVKKIRKRSGILQCTGDIEIIMLDEDNQPIDGIPYWLHLPDGNIRDGKLGSDGKQLEKTVPPGKSLLVLSDSEENLVSRQSLIPDANETLTENNDTCTTEEATTYGATDAAIAQHNRQCASTLSDDETRPLVTILEFEDKIFRTESAVVLPEREDPSEQTTSEHRAVSPVGIIASCLRYAQEHPNEKLLVTGHTDTAGNLDYNQKLSSWRAENVTALLTGNSKRWAKICTGWDRMKIKDYNQILAWIADVRNWECRPKQVDDKDHVRATNRFRKLYNSVGPGNTWATKITEHGASNNKETWEAYFNCYQEFIADELGIAIEELQSLQQALDFHIPLRWVGCNEFHPRVAENKNDFPCETNRRVEVVFIAPADDIPALGCAIGRDSCTREECALYKSEKFLRYLRAPMVSANPWKAYWEPLDKPAQMGQTREMCVTAPGLPQGTPVDVTVRQYHDGELAFTIPKIKATSKDSLVKIPFSSWYRPNRVIHTETMKEGDFFPQVSFDFVVETGGRKQVSPQLIYCDTVFVRYVDDNDKPLAHKAFELLTQWGTYHGKTDGDGVIKIENIPTGGAHVALDNYEAEQ